MAISSYPRTIKNGQIAANGDANSGTGLMLWDSATSTYIAATPSTFSGTAGGATSANQDTQITEAIATNTLLTDSTNSGILVDTLKSLTLSSGGANLSGGACKYVTLINSTTNAKVQYTAAGSAVYLNLEAGYSVRINTVDASNINVKQTTGENQLLEYIVTV